MQHPHTPRFSRCTLMLLLCSLLWSGLGRVCLAADLTASSSVPTVNFDDTSTAENPDWQVGAASDFVIGRARGGGFAGLFVIKGDAPPVSLVVNSVGNVGLGTEFPARKLHLVSGTAPIIRLEQNSSLGNVAHTWELVATDFAFLLQDGTAPFIVEAGAPTNSLFLNKKGQVGFGTSTPQGNLHIGGTANQDIFNGMGPDLNNGPAFNFDYSGNSFGPGSGFFNVRGTTSGVNPSLRFATVNQQRLIITNTGRVGIGPLAPTQLLDVAGTVHATSFIAGSTTLNVPDYVFDPDYKLMPLTELGSYVTTEKHLPDIPSAQEIKTQGVNVSELQMQLLKKVEELTLYTLKQEQTIGEQGKMIQQLTARLAALEQGHRQ